MMGPGFGNMIAAAIIGWLVIGAIVCVAIGVALAFAVPALWHLVAAHVSVKW